MSWRRSCAVTPLRRSLPTGDYSVRALVSDALALHAAFDGDDAVLVGHDWGAITAASVAADAGSSYRRVVTLAVPPFGWMNPTLGTLRPWLAATLRQPWHSWYIAFNQVPGLAERHFARLSVRLWRDWSPGYDATADLAHLADAVPDRAHARAVVSCYRALASAGTKVALAEPAVPLLHLHGDRDGALDPRYHQVVEARVTAPSGAVVAHRAGHFLHLKQPEVVAGHVVDFLRGS